MSEQTQFGRFAHRSRLLAPLGLSRRSIVEQTQIVDTLWGMCRQTTCRTCGRPGWAGCGAHVEQVLGHVPQDERCQCATAGGAKKSWFRR